MTTPLFEALRVGLWGMIADSGRARGM